MRTDHSATIRIMREKAEQLEHGGLDIVLRPMDQALLYRLAADLLEVHDATGINLHEWPVPFHFVQRWTGLPVRDNGA